ncbi:hypothetical protein [Nocardioides sp. InS609-2]|uniref:hypothetical protein n=1 Tax=Nocardioides sp. InS609-2 TaxID=2760705 RepID=UPI0020BF1DC6|nr:hypothetical protein [Nocardioides sp. InS609-2]
MKRIAGLSTAALLALLVPVSASSATDAAREELVPITQRAIAAVALEHLPTDTTSRSAMYTHQRHPDGLLGADLRYNGDGEYDGDLVRVSVGPRHEASCSEYSHCADLASPPGTTTTLVWQLEEPEEDPGIVLVVYRHDDEQVIAYSSGDTITKDPRQMQLQFPVDMITSVAQDPRLRLLTTQAVVDLGAALADWEGGEPDPLALTIVPSSDRALAAAYILSRSGFGAYKTMHPSPLKRRFGTGTLGARLTFKKGWGYTGTHDVLAIPRPPDWMKNPCKKRFAGHCVTIERARGRIRFAWRPSRPGRPGETWAIHVREAETVAIRTSGYRVPEDRAEAMEASYWHSMRSQIVRRTLGLTTTKETSEDRFATRRWPS